MINSHWLVSNCEVIVNILCQSQSWNFKCKMKNWKSNHKFSKSTFWIPTYGISNEWRRVYFKLKNYNLLIWCVNFMLRISTNLVYCFPNIVPNPMIVKINNNCWVPSSGIDLSQFLVFEYSIFDNCEIQTVQVFIEMCLTYCPIYFSPC